MKRLLYTLLLLFSLTLGVHANDLLIKAESAYDSKKYKVAIESYEQLITKGFKSWQLYFNLGNAYYKNKELGKAIYNYELARKLNPNDEDVRINLGIASAKTIDKIDSKENFFISAVKTNVLASFNTEGWAWISIVSVIALCIFIFVFFTTRTVFLKRLSFLLSFLLIIAALLTYFLGYSALKSKNDNKFAIILSKESKIMNEPTPTANSKFSLHEGTKIRVVENNGDWVLIKLDNGNEGWLKLVEVGII